MWFCYKDSRKNKTKATAHHCDRGGAHFSGLKHIRANSTEPRYFLYSEGVIINYAVCGASGEDIDGWYIVNNEPGNNSSSCKRH